MGSGAFFGSLILIGIDLVDSGTALAAFETTIGWETDFAKGEEAADAGTVDSLEIGTVVFVGSEVVTVVTCGVAGEVSAIDFNGGVDGCETAIALLGIELVVDLVSSMIAVVEVAADAVDKGTVEAAEAG